MQARRRRPLSALVTALICVATVSVAAVEVLRVSALTRAGRLLVTVELDGAFTGELRDTILSGLQTTFSYDIALHRETAFWPDPTVGAVTLEASVRYDNLTEQYTVIRSVDGRVEETVVVDDESTVRRFLTRFDRLPLFSTTALEPNGSYRVRVRVETRPRNAWFLFPWARAAASGVARFIFLP